MRKVVTKLCTTDNHLLLEPNLRVGTYHTAEDFVEEGGGQGQDAIDLGGPTSGITSKSIRKYFLWHYESTAPVLSLASECFAEFFRQLMDGSYMLYVDEIVEKKPGHTERTISSRRAFYQATGGEVFVPMTDDALGEKTPRRAEALKFYESVGKTILEASRARGCVVKVLVLQ